MERLDKQRSFVILATWDALDGPTEWEVEQTRNAQYEAWLDQHPDEPYPSPAVYNAWLLQ